MKRLKKTIRTIHLWLGLTVGLVVFVVALTGALYAFKEEIENVNQEFRFCVAQNKPFQPPSVLMDSAQRHLPGKLLHAIHYQGPERNVKAIFFANESEKYYWQLYLNPYTGNLVQAVDEETGFFHFILQGHYYLWLPETIGQPVVAISTLVFLAMVVTGLILWWPKNKHVTKQKFTIRWNARWRRRNFDLHQVIGFYTSVVALLFIVTGLVWGFNWFMRSYYYVASGGNSYVDYYEPKSSDVVFNSQEAAVDRVWQLMVKEHPGSINLEIHPPHDSSSVIAANVNPDPGTYWKTDYRYFDQYTLKEYHVSHLWGRWKQASAADKLMRMNYDLHVGALFGIGGKILAFLFSLLIASLPVTGFLIWWGRRKKH